MIVLYGGSQNQIMIPRVAIQLLSCIQLVMPKHVKILRARPVQSQRGHIMAAPIAHRSSTALTSNEILCWMQLYVHHKKVVPAKGVLCYKRGARSKSTKKSKEDCCCWDLSPGCHLKYGITQVFIQKHGMHIRKRGVYNVLNWKNTEYRYGFNCFYTETRHVHTETRRVYRVGPGPGWSVNIYGRVVQFVFLGARVR
jgi:hypothetical protein